MGIHSRRWLLAKALSQTAVAALFQCLVIGCASGGPSSVQGGGSNPIAPAILNQPANQSIPMGLTATFAVPATGSPLNYQWYENGTLIPGATGDTYTTPATAFADTGSAFTVTVSNSLGSVTSTPATLTVTARAPKAGYLRFQQVDATSTVNGYGNGPVGISSGIPGRGGAYFSLSIGTPLYTGPLVPGGWPYEQFNLPNNLLGLGLSVGYEGDFFTNFQADLQSSNFPAGGSPLDSPNSVVTSLDLEPPDGLFAASWIQSSQVSGFAMLQQTVTLANFQAAATQQGVNGRVITAVSYNAGQVVYLAYGWQSDTSTIYETQIATASLQTAATVAAGLAAQGYIITAFGGSILNDSYLLVGTRVEGDTMARPFVASTQNTYTEVMQPGYAMVGLLQDAQGNLTFLGER